MVGIEIRGVEMRAGGRECEGEGRERAEIRQRKDRGTMEKRREYGRETVEKCLRSEREGAERRNEEPRPGGRGFDVAGECVNDPVPMTRDGAPSKKKLSICGEQCISK